MLKVLEFAKDEYEFPSLIVLGCFDAIHSGHRELLKKAQLQAKINGLDLGVMVFKEGKGGKLVYSFEERLAILQQFNVKFVVAIEFNEVFKSIRALDFLKSLEEKINVKAYMSGKDFRFGYNAEGKASTLKKYAADDANGVWYKCVNDKEWEGEKISTTLVKRCLDKGDVAKAAALLDGAFHLSGEVIKGAGRGSTVVGFPTVNICYPDWKYPIKQGVYCVTSVIDERLYAGIANFGTCPTFGDDRVVLEVYFENFSGDLYGRTLTVNFVGFIRDIIQFSSVEELTNQLRRDVESSVSARLAIANG